MERLKYNRINVPIHTDESEDQVIHLLAGPHKTESEAAQTTDRNQKRYRSKQSCHQVD